MSIESTGDFINTKERFAELREALANAQPPVVVYRERANIEDLSSGQQRAMCGISAARAILRSKIRGNI